MHWISRSIRGNFLKERPLTILSLAARSFSTSAMKSDKFELPSRKNPNGKSEFEGTLARTDPAVKVEHPSESNLPSSEPVKGRSAVHHKRTLSSFSLEGKVGVVTGGARGLGLMMSQALIFSGADLAIVDLDSK
jgi:D-arabinitol 2-dehydrogenase